MKLTQIFPFAGLRALAFSLAIVLALISPVRANDPATEPGATNEAALRTSLQLQEQLHASQLALQQNREEREALERELTKRLKALEEGVQDRNTKEVENLKAQLAGLRKDLDKNSHTLLIVGSGIAVIGFFVLLATGYLQWRSVNRLAEFSAIVQSSRAALPAPNNPVSEGNLLGAGTTAQSNGRLFGALSELEKRIAELELTATALPTPKVPTTATGTSGAETDIIAVDHSEATVAPNPEHPLITKGQALLNQGKLEEALASFEELLKTEPKNSEALVKKGLALEQLNRSEEALRCYDRAIEANADLTIAYLQKGGLLNRLERYEEALQCYELALRAQEKAHQS